MDHNCIHEDEIQTHSRKVEALEVRADYKDKRIDEFNETMKEVQKSIDTLDKTINDYILQSIKDDNALKDYISSLENRVTALESAESEKWKLFTGFGIAVTIVSFIINYIILK